MELLLFLLFIVMLVSLLFPLKFFVGFCCWISCCCLWLFHNNMFYFYCWCFCWHDCVVVYFHFKFLLFSPFITISNLTYYIITIHNSSFFIHITIFFISFYLFLFSLRNTATWISFIILRCFQLPFNFLGLYHYFKFQLSCVSFIIQTKLIILNPTELCFIYPWNQTDYNMKPNWLF